jgi:AcrR family transcriptional regulator
MRGLTNYDFRQSTLPKSGAMNSQLKIKADDTRARIMDTAEALFRRLGFAKTAVADIAAELKMSPANVYRFFSSKNAIVEAICQRCLGELEDRAWAVARSPGSAAERIERLVLEIVAFHKENNLTDQRVNDIVLAAIELSWGAIRAHKEHMRMVLEAILREGLEREEFEPIDPRETSRLMLIALVHFCHPVLVAEYLQDQSDLEADARATVRFLLRAVTPRS